MVNTTGVARVPLVTQLENRECGAACLSMVAAYYGLIVPLERTREDCGISERGVSAKGIIRAAKSYGFEAKGYSMEPDLIAERVGFPCIIHWRMKHFVVLCGFKTGRAYIVDPAKGRMRVDREEFDKCFTGVVLKIVPSEAFVPGGRDKSVLTFAKNRLKGRMHIVLALTVLMVAGSVFGYINPRLTQYYYDNVLNGDTVHNLYPFIGVMTIAAAVQIVIALFSTLLSLRADEALSYAGSSGYMEHILKLPVSFFHRRNPGDLASRKETNATVSMSLVSTIAPLIIQSVMMVFYLMVMIRHSLLLTAVGVCTVAVNLLITRVITAKRIDYASASKGDSGRLSSTTLSGLKEMETIRACGAKEGYFERWAGHQAAKNTAKYRFFAMDTYLGIIPEFLSSASNTIVLLCGVFLTMRGDFTLGMTMAFAGFLSAFMMPADTLLSSGSSIASMRTDMDRIEDVMEHPADENICIGEGKVKELSGECRVRDLSFGYRPFEPPYLRDISLDIIPGKGIAVVGHSGSGKTTLAKLIAGIYSPAEGSITFDGFSIKDIDHKVFTGCVAACGQETWIFRGSARDNITMWDDPARESDLEQAIKDACIYDDIKEMGGFDAILSEGGANLSGGQRQRIEIARALYRNPKLLILDEATSAIDAECEQRILENIKKRKIAYIIISHRLSAVRDADEILVMEDGRITERGSHRELIKGGGIYAELILNES